MLLLTTIACKLEAERDPNGPIDSGVDSTDTSAAGFSTYDCFDEPTRAEVLATREHKYIEVRIVDLLDGDGLGRKPRASIDEAIDYLNEQYGADFTFYLPENGIEFYSNGTLYATDLTGDEVESLAAGFLVAGAVNIFIVPQYGGDNIGGACIGGCIGSAEAPLIVVEKGISSSGWAHEVGHYGGLLHTWGNNYESVDGDNCETEGDNICETPADADQSSCEVDSETCSVVSCTTDANGEAYQPDVTNIMSYYPDSCTNHLYQEQLDVVSCVMRAGRPDHLRDEPTSSIDPAPEVVTVGCDAASYLTIQEGVSAVANSGTVEICSGTYTENVVINDFSVTLSGVEEDVVVDGGAVGSVFEISNSDVSLKGMTITNGLNEIWGGGVLASESSLSIESVVFLANSSSLYAGGLFAQDSDVSVTNAVFEGNTAVDTYGAAFFSGSTVAMTGVEFYANSAPDTAAFGITDADNFSATGIYVHENIAGEYNSYTVYIGRSQGDFSDILFENNDAETLMRFIDAEVGITSGVAQNNNISEETIVLTDSSVIWDSGTLTGNQGSPEVNLRTDDGFSTFECHDVVWDDSGEDNRDLEIVKDHVYYFDLENNVDYFCSGETATCDEI